VVIYYLSSGDSSTSRDNNSGGRHPFDAKLCSIL
ncbi:hypothetical protein M513_13815, partial [Trichuris suis]